MSFASGPLKNGCCLAEKETHPYNVLPFASNIQVGVMVGTVQALPHWKCLLSFLLQYSQCCAAYLLKLRCSEVFWILNANVQPPWNTVFRDNDVVEIVLRIMIALLLTWFKWQIHRHMASLNSSRNIRSLKSNCTSSWRSCQHFAEEGETVCDPWLAAFKQLLHSAWIDGNKLVRCTDFREKKAKFPQKRSITISVHLNVSNQPLTAASTVCSR